MGKWLAIGMIVLIGIAHVFMWRSDMPTGMKLTFTTLNAIGWGIVLIPIFFVDKWLDAVQRRNRDDDRTRL